MRPYARLTANTRPGHLENRAHAHAGRATIQRVTASRAHQNAIDVQRSRRAENRADVGVVDNALEDAYAHRALPRRLDDTAQELINWNLTWTTECRERTARHVKARQLLHELHGGNEHRNRTRALAHNQALEQRHHLVEPAFTQKKAHRLISGTHGTLDDLGALRNKDALLRLQHAAQLTLGQSHVGIKPLVLERINSQNLNGISHSSQPAPFFAAPIQISGQRHAPPRHSFQPDNTEGIIGFTPQCDDTSRTHNRRPRHPHRRQSSRPRYAAQSPTQDRRPSRESTCPRDGRSGYE